MRPNLTVFHRRVAETKGISDFGQILTENAQSCGETVVIAGANRFTELEKLFKIVLALEAQIDASAV